MDKDFSPSEELSLFFKRARSKEKLFYEQNAYHRQELKDAIAQARQL